MSRAIISIRLSSLGDLVLCSNFARELEVRYPDSDLFFVTQASFKSFIENSFPTERTQVFSIDPNSKGLFSYFQQGWKMADLLSNTFSSKEIIIYDLHNVAKTWLFCWGLKARCLVLGIKSKTHRSPKRRFQRQSLVWFKSSSLGKRHVFNEHLGLLELAPYSSTPELKSSTRHPKPFSILLAPDAQHWKKRWPEEKWKELLERLLKMEGHPLQITLVGGKNCLSVSLQDWVNSYQGKHSVRNLLGKTHLPELANIAAEHQLCVSGNSAWQHIAESVQSSAISLAGPIVPQFGFSPFRESSIELSVKLDCRPCTLHGDGLCFKKNEAQHACMNQISVEQVFFEIRKRIGF